MRAAKASNPLDLRGARRFEPDARLVEAEPGGVEESVTAHPVEGGLPQIGARRIGRRIRRPMADDVNVRAAPPARGQELGHAVDERGFRHPAAVRERLKRPPDRLAVEAAANEIADVALEPRRRRIDQSPLEGERMEQVVVRHQGVVQIEPDDRQRRCHGRSDFENIAGSGMARTRRQRSTSQATHSADRPARTYVSPAQRI